ncbi:UDP-sulfoquinovose synthase [Litorivivens lipolytica]|uniref:UDP-sulfoquinovose synthase n=1 Tax=Litorivivens lipolytica TaxID=1524264 RepID=A0A7W4Z5X3_9GAMM|nr:aminotransferase class V-fold PLP-dependent enzyme [Litorivivens lipolytica]MBB3047567.1 UDP-sulfoquinovose synthase [Litorivivens lipolytica]
MSQPKKSPILVLGADGYLGWPLSLRLARQNPDRQIVMVDNFLRRRLVRDVGGDSILPILEMKQRLWAAKRVHGIRNMDFIHMDVNSEALEFLIEERRPDAIYHLAQQCSAPYSMRGVDEALLTLRNNEEGNMRLLWAVREYVPDCHVIKLGTFGEYAKGGIDIAEGYFKPVYRGRAASTAIPYPRRADDFYHASKINDTNYIAIACQHWGLRVTDIMQSTVFGTWTEDMEGHPELYTRVDYDECFGTVANRFIAQALCGEPLSVYGTGNQRTGLMALNDAITSLAALWSDVPEKAQHRVINHVTEKSFSVNELADAIVGSARREGLKVTVQRGRFDPRAEQVEAKMAFEIESAYVDSHLKQTDMRDVVHRAFVMLSQHRERIDRSLFAPRNSWQGAGKGESKKRRQKKEDNVVVALPQQNVRRKRAPVLQTEDDWEIFRREQFPYEHLNLNPGTLGSPSEAVLQEIRKAQSPDLLAQPLDQYRRGREVYEEARAEASALWPSDDHELQLVGSASQTSNLLALAFARLGGQMSRPLRVLTTMNEHVGGIGAFERMPEFRICYLSDKEIRDPKAFRALVAGFKPDIALFSHVTYDTGQALPVAQWMKDISELRPGASTLLDVSQSLGVIAPEFEHADVVFGSCHKWLFGPRGTGLLWTNERFRRRVGALNWSGEPLAKGGKDFGFSPSGGLDFSLYAGLLACFRLYRQLGAERLRERSADLALYFRVRLSNMLRSHGIRFRLLEPHLGVPGANGMFSLSFVNFDPYPLYDAMNAHKVHCKCIKDRGRDGRERQLLRFGVPYYETQERMQKALATIEDCLREQLANSSDHSLRYLLKSGATPSPRTEVLASSARPV